MIKFTKKSLLCVAAAGLCLSATAALAQHHDGQHKADQATKAKGDVRKGDPYALGTCPISGGELGSMGDPVVKIYDGREVRFCCAGCIKKFESDKTASWAKVDEQIIKQQLAYYPMETCIISGEPLGGDMGEPVNMVYNNRLVRLCCDHCKGEFDKHPRSYIEKLDAAVIKKQSEHYPLATCLISGEEMASIGDTVNMVYANRLFKLCCEGCIDSFEAKPHAYIAMLDNAWKALHEKGEGAHTDDGDAGHHEGAGHEGKDHDRK